MGLFSTEPARSIVSPPAWSPDGQRMAFAGVDDGAPKLYTVSRDGSDLREVVELENSNANLDASEHGISNAFWSGDGSRIMFSWDGTLYYVNVDGSNLRSTDIDGYFSPSPNGSRIAVLDTGPAASDVAKDRRCALQHGVGRNG